MEDTLLKLYEFVWKWIAEIAANAAAVGGSVTVPTFVVPKTFDELLIQLYSLLGWVYSQYHVATKLLMPDSF